MEQLFFLFTILLIGSAVMTITSSNPIHSVFWLVIVFLYSAGFLISINFEFLALIIVIVYVGAIAILFLFVIMMLDIVQLRKITPVSNVLPILFIISVNILIEAWWLFKYDANNFKYFTIKNWNMEITNHINNIGLNLYTEYAYPLLIISLLLLIAMIGAIVLTLELGLITRKQNLSGQHHRNDSWI